MHRLAALGDRSRAAPRAGAPAAPCSPAEVVSLKAQLRICRPGEIICPRCGQLVPRTHASAGQLFVYCERRFGQERCGTHLFVARGRGDPFVIVSALESALDKERLLALIEPEAVA